MKLVWLTDIHLNFLEKHERIAFYQNIILENGDFLLITGDIAEAPSVEVILREMCSYIKKPIYFVLGNHDYYKGQVNMVRKKMKQLTEEEPLLYWLPVAGIQLLDNHTLLIGQDGWADGRLGNYYNSNVSANDSRLIIDLFQQKILGKKPLLEKMQQLADQDAKQLKSQLEYALIRNSRKIIVLTHVPPFKEVATYKGKISDDNYLPFYTSKATGDILLQIARENNQVEFLVLCGHTHDTAIYKPLDNLTVKTGKAAYYAPIVQEIIELGPS